MKFTKPVGATADLRELEYISSLHQTGKSLRRNGSIRTEDIAKFLMSRYGIKITEEEVADTIAQGFGGGGLSEEDGGTIDLTEIAALLLVPALIKAEMSLHRDHLERQTIKTGFDNDEAMADAIANDHDLHTRKSGGDYVWSSETTGKTLALRAELRWPDSDLIPHVLGMILTDVTGDSSPKTMTKDLLQKIFVFYGEHEVAENDELLEEMISLASSMKMDADGQGRDWEPILDAFTFAHCLTEDVRRYDVKSENRLSTNYSDVFEYDQLEEDVCKVETAWTAPAIDYAVDTFQNKLYVILLWVNWALFFYVFMSASAGKLGQLNCTNDVESADFGCQIAQGIVNWLIIMTKLIVVGSFSVMLCSMGHSISPTSPKLIVMSILSMGCIILFTFIPAFIHGRFLADENGNAVINTERDDLGPDRKFLVYVMVAFGTVLLLLALQHVLVRIIPARYLSDMVLLKKIPIGTVAMEYNMKKAASFKINKLIRNARAIHAAADFEHGTGLPSSRESSYGRALLSFVKVADDLEEVGGRCWTLKRLWNGTLYTEDGIWLNNRMLQGNIGQLVLCLWLIPFLEVIIEFLRDFYEGYLVDVAPAKWRIMVPLALAFFLAEFNALKLATSYIPSSVKTTLRFRYGMFGSLHDSEFENLRATVDDASFIFGAMFWGCLYSSALILILSLLIFGLLCFEPFLPIVIQVVAIVVGISITIAIKMIFLMIARRRFHRRAFYRTNPAAANIINNILEAWSLGITTLYVAQRMIFLLSASFIFVGRIDIPFLAEDADQLGPMSLDMFPSIFRKDILTHEAHRHPYLERIGIMYMLKLRHGEGFGRTAGTSWRLLFVYALLPWLRKYRLRSDDNIDVDNFNFRQDSPALRRPTYTEPNVLHGSKSLAKIEGSAVLNSKDDNEQATIAELRKENEKLKEENHKLRMAAQSNSAEILNL